MLVYEELIDFVRKMRNAKVVPIEKLMDDRGMRIKAIALRHDVDAGIWSAPAMARLVSDAALPAVFYVLHTATYYGAWSGKRSGVFVRQPGCEAFLDRMAACDVELGLHTDALGVYQDHCTDGMAAIRQELSWLRGRGIEIRGSTAHNSVSS